MKEIVRLFPEHLQPLLQKGVDWSAVQELRIRVNRKVETLGQYGHKMLGEHVMQPSDLSYMLNQISQFSLYRFKDELREGFITVEGGHRVGLAGKANTVNDHVDTLKHISFMNIRVARSSSGQAEQLVPYLYENGKWLTTLIIGPPHSGKTTLLRGLASIIGSEHHLCPASKVALVDERSELAASLRGVPQLDVGERTDVMDACPKAEGMMMMIRSMSPEVLIVDEIGGTKDAEAIREAMLTGVDVMCSIHGDSLETLQKRPSAQSLISEGVFERFVILDRMRPNVPGRAVIYRNDGRVLAECERRNRDAVDRSRHRVNRHHVGRV